MHSGDFFRSNKAFITYQKKEYGHRLIYYAASSFDAKVSSVIQNKEWHWRPARSEELVDIQSKLCQIQFKECDRVVWTITASGKFTCVATWQHLRHKQKEVQWWKLLWFYGTI
jgi:hypothetical protein